MKQGSLFNPRTDAIFQKATKQNKYPIHLKMTSDCITVYRRRWVISLWAILIISLHHQKVLLELAGHWWISSFLPQYKTNYFPAFFITTMFFFFLAPSYWVSSSFLVICVALSNVL